MADAKDSKRKLRNTWLLTGGSGAVLLGTGISGAIECGFLKHSGGIWWQWVLCGTVSLVLVMVGIILLIKSAFMERDLK